MSETRKKKIDRLNEIQKDLKLKSEKLKFSVKKICFPEQLAFIEDPNDRKTLVCSRRSGKTQGCAYHLVQTCLENPYAECLYITLSRTSAKRILWRKLLQIDREFNLNLHFQQQELVVAFPNGSIIYLSGAKDPWEAEKFRGQAFHLVYIDEAQSFKKYIYDVINDVIEPTLVDFGGTLCITGTPNATCKGLLHDAFHHAKGFVGWSSHKWDMYANIKLPQVVSGKKTVDQILADIRKKKGVTERDPGYRREYLGEWVKSNKELVYKYCSTKNYYSRALIDISPQWSYVLGVDLGWDDATAFVVLGYSPDSPHLYVVEEYKSAKMDIGQVADKINELEGRYRFKDKIIDAGALGKQITESLSRMYKISLKAAIKTRKLEYIELVNDHLRTGKIKIRSETELVEEMELLQWDMSSQKPREDDKYENHLCDAFLYAFRSCYHYAYKERLSNPSEDDPEYGHFIHLKRAKKHEEDKSSKEARNRRKHKRGYRR